MINVYMRILLMIVGVIVGVAHHKMAFKEMFTFGTKEPFASWIFFVAGPLSTLPASMLAFFLPGPAGIWLLSGGALSFAALVAEIGTPDNTGPLIVFFIWYSAPMLLLGLFSVLGGKVTDKEAGRKEAKGAWILSGGALCLATVFAAWEGQKRVSWFMMNLLLYIPAFFLLISWVLVRRAYKRRARPLG